MVIAVTMAWVARKWPILHDRPLRITWLRIMHWSPQLVSAGSSQFHFTMTRWRIKSPASTVYSGADQRINKSSAPLAFVQRFRRWLVNSPHKWAVIRKMFLFDDVVMIFIWLKNVRWLENPCTTNIDNSVTRLFDSYLTLKHKKFNNIQACQEASSLISYVHFIWHVENPMLIEYEYVGD